MFSLAERISPGFLDRRVEILGRAVGPALISGRKSLSCAAFCQVDAKLRQLGGHGMLAVTGAGGPLSTANSLAANRVPAGLSCCQHAGCCARRPPLLACSLPLGCVDQAAVALLGNTTF
jgi:hypothetical protein